ncbi:hypothetical protein [Bradyrhizobium sp. LA2.1]|uniref:hypothetical protein n=1 Tax=Bradyrhizobium sp. LA2.1 TaxID=3156376 RepID=UPI003392E5B4
MITEKTPSPALAALIAATADLHDLTEAPARVEARAAALVRLGSSEGDILLEVIDQIGIDAMVERNLEFADRSGDGPKLR